MKKFLTYVPLIILVVVIAAPLTMLAAAPNTSVIGDNIKPGSEIGGVLPEKYDGMMNTGLIFEYNKKPPVSIANVQKSGGNLVVTLDTSGLAGDVIGDVFFAAYSAEGRLRYVSDRKDALFRTNAYTWTGVDYSGVARIAAFVWDKETMKPLCVSKDIIAN